MTEYRGYTIASLGSYTPRVTVSHRGVWVCIADSIDDAKKRIDIGEHLAGQYLTILASQT